MGRQPGYNKRPHAQLPTSFLDMDAWMAIKLNVASFDSQATWVIDVLGLLFEMLFKGVCTTRHWQTFSRLVQGLNGCTVCGVCTSSSFSAIAQQVTGQL